METIRHAAPGQTALDEMPPADDDSAGLSTFRFFTILALPTLKSLEQGVVRAKVGHSDAQIGE